MYKLRNASSINSLVCNPSIRLILYSNKMTKFVELLEAIARSSIVKVDEILSDEGQNVRFLLAEEDTSKYTPLFHACLHPSQEFGERVVRIMIEKGADPLHIDNNGQDVMYYLAKDGKDKIMKFLINKFKFQLNRNDNISQTPLFWASAKNNINCAKLLLGHGADPNHIDFNGQTPIFYAAGAGHRQMCQVLTDHGANFQHIDNNRETPLHYARKNKHKRIAEFINSLKNQKVRQRQMSRMESSAQESKIVRKKKQVAKNEFCLVYTNQKGQVHELTIEEIQQFAKYSYEYQNILELLLNPDKLDSQPNPEQKKFEKTVAKILTFFMKHQQGFHFLDPVDYVAMNLPDYPLKIKNPMDFNTIKTKLTFNCYGSEEQFCEDMMLVFDNCITYNGPQSLYGKVAMQLKFQFYTMYKKQFAI